MTTEVLKENNFYKTADLALTAAVSLFYPVEAIDRQNPKKAQFIFKRGKALDVLIESYWQGKLRVDPASYFNALRVIKARLYGEE